MGNEVWAREHGTLKEAVLGETPGTRRAAGRSRWRFMAQENSRLSDRSENGPTVLSFPQRSL